ncbi:MAG: hypothetical protein ISR58_16780 [Anaerolineales bacterium]|nr:hypothetical protein [Chloroflexota bacterium]MBL6982830.1 hypothetical protein [Anaerolineales bacterium]
MNIKKIAICHHRNWTCSFFSFIGLIFFSQYDRITQNTGQEEVQFFPEYPHPESFLVVADVISVDNLNGSLTIRLEFYPPDGLLDEDHLLTEDVLLDVYGTAGETEILTKKGSG